MFQKAVKSQSKLRMAITGPSGSGKTYTALNLAINLGLSVAVVDTEKGSAAKYADLFNFDVLEMDPPFHPHRFVEAIQAAHQNGYDVLVIDSLSHAWNGTGGILELVDQFAAKQKTKNTFAAWKEATPIQNRLVDAITRAPIHVIATMRSKQEYVIEQVERNGRTTNIPRKIGMAPIQRDQFEYEFDIFADMDLEHNLIISKTRCAALDGGVFSRPGSEVADIIERWLSDGEQVISTDIPIIESDDIAPPLTNGAAKKQARLDRLNELNDEYKELTGKRKQYDDGWLTECSTEDIEAEGKKLRNEVDQLKAGQPHLFENEPANNYSLEA